MGRGNHGFLFFNKDAQDIIDIQRRPRLLLMTIKINAYPPREITWEEIQMTRRLIIGLCVIGLLTGTSLLAREARTGPIGEISPIAGFPLLVDQAITVLFDDSMDPSALSLGGDLAAENPTAIWSSRAYRNDTVRLIPPAGWSPGTNRTLTVRGVNRTGQSSNMIVASFSIYSGFIYVDVANIGTEDGTPSNPYNTIQEGIDNAFPGWAVMVAGGDYNGNFGANGFPVVTLADDISLFGGFNPADWDVRNPALYPTRIIDNSTTGIGRAVYGHTITDKTVIDGFEIIGGSSEQSMAIFNDDHSSPIIQNNSIDGGRPNSAVASILSSYGILNLNVSSPLIQNNSIYGGRPDSTIADVVASFGIVNRSGSSPVIRNNKIDGGDPVIDKQAGTSGASANAFGILNSYPDTAPDIHENDIDGGSPYAYSGNHQASARSTGIRSSSAFSPSIANNNIYGGNPLAISSSTVHPTSAWSVGIIGWEGTLLEITGNRINGGNLRSVSRNYVAQGYSIAVASYTNQSVVLEDNELYAGSPFCQSYGPTAQCNAYGFYCENAHQDEVAQPTLVVGNNAIDGGKATAFGSVSGDAYGFVMGLFFSVINKSSTTLIPSRTMIDVEVFNNVINGGEAEAATDSISRGIFVTGNANYITVGSSEVIFDMSILNNTIDGGQGQDKAMAYSASPYAAQGCTTTISPRIENNIIFSSASTPPTHTGIHEMPESGAGTSINDPLTVQNNDIFAYNNGNNWIPYWDEGSTAIPNIQAMEALNDMTAQGNVDVDPVFDMGSPDQRHLGPNSPVAVTQGGLNGANQGWSFTIDKDGNLRSPLDTSPTGWSMGAYEFQ